MQDVPFSVMCCYTCLPVNAHNPGYRAAPELIPKLIITECSALAFGNNERICFIFCLYSV